MAEFRAREEFAFGNMIIRQGQEVDILDHKLARRLLDEGRIQIAYPDSNRKPKEVHDGQEEVHIEPRSHVA